MLARREQARWSADGTELFYVEGTALLSVSVSTGSDFSVGSVERLFQHPNLARSFYPQYDVSPDGERIVVAAAFTVDATEPEINVVLNWYEEFRDRDQD